MFNSKIESIKMSARRFRLALEKCPKNILPGQFKEFPSGSCGDASLLLAKYLTSGGLGQFDYVKGETGSRRDGTWHTHGWIQQSDLIIDITADQFPEVDIPVIVTADRTWHDRFQIKDVHSADLDYYDGQTKAELSVVYYKVVEYLGTQ